MSSLRPALPLVLALLSACGGGGEVTGGAAAVTSIAVQSGNQQSARAGETLPQPFVVQVLDQRRQPMANEPVTVTITGGGSFLGTLPTSTDGSGRVAFPPFRLGREAGAQSVTVRAGTRAQDITLTAESAYELDIRFVGSIDPALQAAFTTAARRVRGLVVGAVPPVRFSNTDLSGCGSWLNGTRLNETVPGVVVYAQVTSLSAGVVGSAGPCYVREPVASDARTVVGVMRFNSSFLQPLSTDGRLLDTVLHEMLHVLGVGTLWETRGFVADTGLATWRYVAPRATEACRAAGGASACAAGVPIETEGSDGTRGGHWRSPTLGAELMTGYLLRAGLARPLSNITAQSLQDLGYVVNSAAVDPFTVPGTLAILGFGPAEPAGGAPALEPERVRPIAAVTADGILRALPRR